MKKFYTLLAAAAVTVSSVSAAQRANCDYAQFAKTTEAAVAEKHYATPIHAQHKGAVKAVAAADITGTNFIQFYVVGNDGWSGPEMDSFEIVAGANANEYIIKGLVWGEEAFDLNATYSTVTEQGMTFDLLTIAAGQDWFVNQGKTCKLGIGFADPNTGAWGGNLKDEAEFMLVEGSNGDKYWVPAWAFQNQSDDALSGLAWGYQVSETSWNGNVFPGSYLYHSNATFTGEYTEDGETFEAETYGVYAVVTDRFGKKNIQLYNVGGGMPMTLNVVGDVASATDQVYGYYYTDNTHTTTTPVYYWNNEDVNSEVMLVSGNVGVEDGKSILDFGGLFVYWPTKGWGFAWNNAKVNFNKDYGFVAAGINNVAADIDENAPVEYFNLQGVRVENPANGLYIQRQGNKVAKVIL